MQLKDAAKYEILYDLPAGEYNPAEVGGVTTKTIRAGDSLEVESFPILHITSGVSREKKNRRSGRQQQELNLRNTRKRIRRLAEANFTSKDVFWTGTYPYPRYDPGFANLDQIRKEMLKAGCPEDESDVRRDFRNFINRLKRRMNAAHEDPKQLKYIYVIESSHEPKEGERNPLPAHYHIHAMIHAPGLSRAEIEECWHGGYSNTRKLDFSTNGIEGLCKYLTKQRRCAHRWAASRNLKQPDIRKSCRKISRRRAAAIAADAQYQGKEIFEALYPGYHVEEVTVKYSDFVSGAYIYARMRRIQTPMRN